MPNVWKPKLFETESLDTFQFFLTRESNTGLLILSPCPPTHPLYMQAIKALYAMPQLTFNQTIYLRDLQYTFELAMSAYMQACFNDETIRLAAKFMQDMHLLADELYAVARRLDLAMQVRYPRECDDPMLTANQLKNKPVKIVKKASKKRHSFTPESISSKFATADGVENLIKFPVSL